MSPRDLLSDPCWQGADLGHPLPDATHAVSMALPRWQDVIAYEEKDPACRQALQTIYPRFGLHPLLQTLTARMAVDGLTAWPFATEVAARAAQAHCQRKSPQAHTQRTNFGSLVALHTDAGATPHAKAFWQHTGLGASSRQAAVALGLETAPSATEADAARTAVCQRLAAIHGIEAERISLHPAGMAGLHAALTAIQQLRPQRPTLQLGFPYVDVLKQPQVVFHGGELLQPQTLAEVEAALDQHQPAAVIVELPSNPLLRCVNLPEIAALAHVRGIPVIADDTIGSGLNINALPHADLVFSSLTKSFAGRGDVLAGGLVINPSSPWSGTWAHGTTSRQAVADLAGADAIALEQGSRDVSIRVSRLNTNTQLLASRLRQHSAVAQVFHPGSCERFAMLRRAGGGHGCLLSFELKGGLSKAARVYDALEVCKGPSLGTAFTLACPYVLLAHYSELPWAKSCGIPAHLLRVSVGLEDHEGLWGRFERALSA